MSTTGKQQASAHGSPIGHRGPGLLAGLRIRKKLILLHTVFSLALAGILLVPLGPALRMVVASGENQQAVATLRKAMLDPTLGIEGVMSVEAEALPGSLRRRADSAPGEPQVWPGDAPAWSAVVALGDAGPYLAVRVRHEEATAAARKVYILAIVALLAVYALVAAALEFFVLPRQVYAPIRRMLEADAAVQRGDQSNELIPDAQIPADELGEIMRSRNASIRGLREHEAELADTLDRLEIVADDLRKKNHLLETARRNLEGADRLASLGMMSAGIAHEMNTPLVVAKGLGEKLREGPTEGLSAAEATLLVRVIGRLERLSESLLDFARARPAPSDAVDLGAVIQEALTLVRLDRDVSSVRVETRAPQGLTVPGDEDRLVQVMVNLIRNAADALTAHRVERPEIVIEGGTQRREGTDWVALTITDNGPGIDPELLPTLFEPFVSSRLDAKGTGLGLAVAEGIVREHSGVLLARNRPGRAGAIFEIMLPATRPGRDDDQDPPARRGASKETQA